MKKEKTRLELMREKLGINKMDDFESVEAENLAVIEREYGQSITEDYLVTKYNNQLETFIRLKKQEIQNQGGTGSTTFR